jgi:hypothetical protein
VAEAERITLPFADTGSDTPGATTTIWSTDKCEYNGSSRCASRTADQSVWAWALPMQVPA